MNLSRTKILKEGYKYPDDLVALKPTKHVMDRLEERGLSIECIPTMVRVTKDNIYSGKSDDGKKLNSVVVRLKYSSNKFIYICMNPWDGAMKSLWFDKIKKDGCPYIGDIRQAA